MSKPRSASTFPPMVTVHDTLQSCPYLPTQVARMPLQWPLETVGESTLDRLLEAGFRRSGMFFYRTECPNCTACEPTRVSVREFCWSKGFRRVLNRGDRLLRMKKGLPQCDDQRLLLFNRHNQERALDVRRQGPADVEEYRTFLVESICQTMEWTFWLEDELVAVSTVDYGATGLSAVYCYFNPDHGSLSLGTYSILKLFQFAEETGRTYVYLGLYVAENRHLKYKSRFVPQERRVKYKWIPFANAPGNETE